MTVRSNWRYFFDEHAPYYNRNAFTKNSIAEVDFLLEVLRLPRGGRILDVGCGTGRHAIELAKRGYQVVGIDISPSMLGEAKKAAKENRVEVDWIRADAVKFESPPIFDVAVCLCEGAFGLLGIDDEPVEHDSAILRNICSALKPDAQLILTTLNAYAKIRLTSQADVEAGSFDPISMVEFITELAVPEGRKQVRLREKFYTPVELGMLLSRVGFSVEHVWGGTAGDWGRRAIKLDEVEFMVIARKLGD